MDAPSEHRSARMRHHHEDDSLVFPRRPADNLSLDVDSSRHARVFHDNVLSGSDMDTYNKTSQTNARLFVIGGFCCFVFLLATVTIYSSLNDGSNVNMRGLDEIVEKDTESEFLSEDEILEEAFPEDGENLDGHVTEGGDVISEFFGEELDDGLIIPDIEPSDESELVNEDISVISEGDDLSEITQEKGNKQVFVMELKEDRYEIIIGKDGDFELPEGLDLNPHSREHWELMEKLLGFGDYDNDYEDKIIGADGEGRLEPPLPSEDKTDQEGIEEDEMVAVEAKVAAAAKGATEAKVRMPDGLLFEAPPSNEEHVHGEGCDPVSVDVKDGFKELAAGDKALGAEEGETK